MEYDDAPYKQSRSTLRRRFGPRTITSRGPEQGDVLPGTLPGQTPRGVWDTFFDKGKQASAARLTSRYMQPQGSPAVPLVRPVTDGWIAPTAKDSASIASKYRTLPSTAGLPPLSPAGQTMTNAWGKSPSATAAIDLAPTTPPVAFNGSDYLDSVLSAMSADTGIPAPVPTESKLAQLAGPSVWGQPISLEDDDPWKFTL